MLLHYAGKRQQHWLVCDGKALALNSVRDGTNGQPEAVLWDGNLCAFTTPLVALDAAVAAGQLRSRTSALAAARQLANAGPADNRTPREATYPTAELAEIRDRSRWITILPLVRQHVRSWYAIARFMAECGEHAYAKALRSSADICASGNAPREAVRAAVYCAYHLTAPNGALTCDLRRHTRKPRNESAVECFHDDWDDSDMALHDLEAQGRKHAAEDRAWLRKRFGRGSLTA